MSSVMPSGPPALLSYPPQKQARGNAASLAYWPFVISCIPSDIDRTEALIGLVHQHAKWIREMRHDVFRRLEPSTMQVSFERICLPLITVDNEDLRIRKILYTEERLRGKANVDPEPSIIRLSYRALLQSPLDNVNFSIIPHLKRIQLVNRPPDPEMRIWLDLKVARNKKVAPRWLATPFQLEYLKTELSKMLYSHGRPQILLNKSRGLFLGQEGGGELPLERWGRVFDFYPRDGIVEAICYKSSFGRLTGRGILP